MSVMNKSIEIPQENQDEYKELLAKWKGQTAEYKKDNQAEYRAFYNRLKKPSINEAKRNKYHNNEEHRLKHLNACKKYNDENADSIRKKKGEWYEKNVESERKKNSIYNSATHHCDVCDKDMTRGARYKHNHGKRHLAKVEQQKSLIVV